LHGPEVCPSRPLRSGAEPTGHREPSHAGGRSGAHRVSQPVAPVRASGAQPRRPSERSPTGYRNRLRPSGIDGRGHTLDRNRLHPPVPCPRSEFRSAVTERAGTVDPSPEGALELVDILVLVIVVAAGVG